MTHSRSMVQVSRTQAVVVRKLPMSCTLSCNKSHVTLLVSYFIAMHCHSLSDGYKRTWEKAYYAYMGELWELHELRHTHSGLQVVARILNILKILLRHFLTIHEICRHESDLIQHTATPLEQSHNMGNSQKVGEDKCLSTNPPQCDRGFPHELNSSFALHELNSIVMFWLFLQKHEFIISML